MKKRIVTLAIAATMVMSSVFTAFAENSVSASPDGSVSVSPNGSVDGSSSADGGNNDLDMDEAKPGIVDQATADAIANSANKYLGEGFELKVNVIGSGEVYDLFTKAANAKVFDIKKAVLVDLDLLKNGEKVGNGEYKITLDLAAFGEVLKNAKYVKVFRLDGEAFNLIDHVTVEDGKFTFTTDHFTPYVFEATDEAPKAPVEEAPKPAAPKPAAPTGDDFSVVPFAVAGVAAVAAIGAAVVLKKKETEE